MTIWSWLQRYFMIEDDEEEDFPCGPGWIGEESDTQIDAGSKKIEDGDSN